MIKAVLTVRSRPDMSVAVFRAYYVRIHAPFADSLPGLRRHVQSPPATGPDLHPDGTAIAVSEFWFDDRRGLDTAVRSQAWSELQDNLRFFCAVDEATLLLVDCTTVFPEPLDQAAVWERAPYYLPHSTQAAYANS